jgi:hypothetical protein
MDTSVTRKKNNPVISIPQSKSILFALGILISILNFTIELDKAKKTPGPQSYKIDEKAVKNMRNS